jgi:hypothetical protein
MNPRIYKSLNVGEGKRLGLNLGWFNDDHTIFGFNILQISDQFITILGIDLLGLHFSIYYSWD